MSMFWIYLGIYAFGCVLMLVYFLTGRTPALNERNWPWPVVFLWPLLVLWPVHALAGFFLKRWARKQK